MTVVQSFFILLIAAFTISCGNNSQRTLDVSQDTTVATSNNDANVDSITLQTVAEGFTAPVYLTQPANDNRLFVVDQVGKIYIINNGQKSAQPFLDISSKIVQLKTDQEEERGLLGLAFHPDYKSNGKFYVYYSAPLRSSAPKTGTVLQPLLSIKFLRLIRTKQILLPGGWYYKLTSRSTTTMPVH
ncbi:MAG: PQQ-dependent sugar dehydrogenase [Segetibacter sp.]